MRKGGEYKTQGADTCVYIPHVACAKKGKRTTLRRSPAGTEFVSRITRDAYELNVQKAVAKALDKLPDMAKFFNLADSACTPEFKPEDKRERCTVRLLQGSPEPLINLVTPVQGDTLARSIYAKTKPDALIKSSLKDMMFAMTRMNSINITHSDSHFNNLGWRGDQLVIFDWGRGTTDKRSFKRMTNNYMSLWTPDQKDNMKKYSQHTLQFALIDEMIFTRSIKKPGAYATLASVWDVLGLLGPARAAGVVSEEKSAAFMKEVFTSISTTPKQTLTDALFSTLIPNLFSDPPAIHAVVAERPMPPAEAQAVSRIIPESETSSGVVTPPPKADKKIEDIKDACRKLLAPAGGRKITHRQRLPRLY